MLSHRSMLRRTASAYGGRVALVDERGSTLTYRELDAVTDQLATALLGSGLRPGDRVVWLEKNRLEYLVAYFATAKAGLLFAPLNYWLRPAELAQLIELVEPKCVMVGDDFREVVDGLDVTRSVPLLVSLGASAAGWTPWRDLLGGPSDGSLDRVDDDEHAIHEIVFTSGTTGQAKGVMRSQRGRILDSMMAALAFELTRRDHMLFFGPQFHIGGASGPNQLLIQGGTVSIITFDPEVACERIAAGVTYVIGVPAHYNLMFESGMLERIDTAHVRGAYVGGSVATRSLFERITAHFPFADLVHGYGSTESGPHTMALRGPDFLEHFGALGLPVPGAEVKIVSAEGDEVARGEIGELAVRSDSVMAGYYKRPELTAAVLGADGWLRTGDLVRQDEFEYFHMAGRAKEMIISGGENVYPKEVEDLLATHDAVAEVAVIGLPDPVYEERVVAFVRPHPNGERPTEVELIGYVRSRLAGFKTPKEVHLVDDFPRTPLGKIAKEQLKQQHGDVFDDVAG